MTISDINLEIRSICDTDTTGLPAATLLYRVNQAYEQITAKIMKETVGSWPFGDSNYTTFQTYTLNLSNSEPFYQIDSLTTPLIIMAVEVLDDDGNWHPLKPITLQDIRATGIAQSEYQETDGMPLEYEKRENAIVLYPAPDNGVSVTLTNGLRIFFLRTADTFTSAQVTTGTKEPGFPSPYHMLIVYMAAMPHLINYKPDRVSYYENKRIQLEKELKDNPAEFAVIKLMDKVVDAVQAVVEEKIDMFNSAGKAQA